MLLLAVCALGLLAMAGAEVLLATLMKIENVVKDKEGYKIKEKHWVRDGEICVIR